MLKHAAFLGAAVLAVGCGESDTVSAWGGSVDTLPGGWIHVQNPATPVWDSATAWQLRESWRIGRRHGVGADVFGRITAMDVDEAEWVYVLDYQAMEVRVFRADGTLLSRFGRRGSGPNELRNPAGLEAFADGRVLVVDYGNARYMVFYTAGSLVEAKPRRLPMNSSPWRGAVDASGSVYEWLRINDSEGRRDVLIYGDAESVVDTFAIPVERVPRIEWNIPGGVASTDVPFGAKFIWRIDTREPSFWFARSDAYRVVRVDLQGDTLLVIERDVEPVPVSPMERDSVLESLGSHIRSQGGKLDPSAIPETKAILKSLHLDPDGNLWVRVRTDNGDALDVFDSSGRYLGQLELPDAVAEFPEIQIASEAVYGIMLDELGVQFLVKYMILRPLRT